MTKISLYTLDPAPTADDLIVMVDSATNTTKKATVQSVVEAIISDKGWETGLDAPASVAYNGNRSYDLVFTGVDYTTLVSNGMRIRTERTVSAPNQCADFDSSSSQYYSSTAPSGLTFTSDYTLMAWVKLESYADGCVVSRWDGATGFFLDINSTGNLRSFADQGASSDDISSRASIPLGRWVHVAARMNCSANVFSLYIDGISVPTVETSTAATAIVQAGDIEIGSRNGANFFNGKIAQVGIFDTVITDSQIRSYATRGLLGSETNCVGAWSLDNDITDLDSNGNDMTDSGGVSATDSDSPFGNYGLSSTIDYGVITGSVFSTDTTLTVQVPEGCTIPTSGGVASIDYSLADTPYGFVKSKGRWRVSSLFRANQITTSNANFGAFASGGFALTIPVGMTPGYAVSLFNSTTTPVYFNLSPTSIIGTTLGNEDKRFTARVQSGAASTSTNSVYRKVDDVLTASQETYTFYTHGATTSAGMTAVSEHCEIFAECAYV